MQHVFYTLASCPLIVILDVMDISSIVFVVVLILSVVFHEVAHGYAADALGDPTARLKGRLSLNPLVHLDWVGSVILPFILIVSGAPFVLGWAKPVPFNLYNFKNPRWGGALVALAGPATNLVIAVIGSILMLVIDPGVGGTLVLTSLVVTNVALAVFNLVPIPPLDGHHVLFALIGERFAEVTAFLRRYSMIVLVLYVLYGWHLIDPIIYLVSNILLP